MAKHFLIVFLVLIVTEFGGVSSSQPYFSIVGSRILRSDEVYRCAVTNFNFPGTLDVQLTIQGNRSEDGQSAELTQNVSVGTNKTVIVEFDADVLSHGNYKLIAQSLNNNLPFSKFRYLYYQRKKFSLMIQTDKPTYKAGEVLNFRVIRLDSTSRPYKSKESCSIQVFDANGYKNKEWADAEFNSGVFEASLLLPKESSFGRWKIQVFSEGKIFIKQIPVAEYTIPENLLSVSLPSYVYYTDQIILSVKAIKFTGLPISGVVTVNALDWLYTFSINGTETIEIDPQNDLQIGTTWTDCGVVKFQVKLITSDNATVSSIATTNICPKKYIIILADYTQTFVPGMVYQYTIIVKSYNGKPAEQGTVINIDEYYWNSSLIERNSYVLNKKGMAIVSRTIPLNATDLVIEATYIDTTESFFIPKNDLADKMMLISLVTKRPKLYDEVHIAVDLLENIPFISYQVFSKGILVRAKMVKVQDRSATILFVPKFSFAPEATLVVHYIREGDGKIISDYIKIPFEQQLPNFLAIRLLNETCKPGENISLSLISTRLSNVSLSAIDQRVFLQRPSFGISRKTLLKDFADYSYMSFYYDDIDEDIIAGDNHELVFQSTNSYIMSNGVTSSDDRPMITSNNQNIVIVGSEDQDSSDLSDDILMSIRNDDIQSFLFQTVNIQEVAMAKPRGIARISVQVPNTVTSWVISAFSVNPHFGFGVLDNNVVLHTFSPYFLQVNLPYSMKRFEIVTLEIYLYNYLNSTQNSLITIDRDDNKFDLIDGELFGWRAQKSIYVQKVDMLSNNVGIFRVSIMPKVAGFVKLRIKAIGSSAGDTVEQTLRVVPDGIEKFVFNSSFVQKASQTKLSCAINENEVQTRLFTEVSITGNILGNFLDDMINLIDSTEDCEYCIYNFIVLHKYLDTTKQLTDVLKGKILFNIENSYRQLLQNVKFEDSASISFADKDDPRFMWFMSYLIKSFVSASTLITIDDTVAEKILHYLLEHQSVDGHFFERDEFELNIALTAYVASVLKEIVPFIPELQENLDHALNYISNNTDFSDVLSLAVASYVLSLNNHPKAQTFISQLSSREIETFEHISWNNLNQISPYTNIETTAFAFLVYQRVPALSAKGPKIARWLISNLRKSNSSCSHFGSLVGFQALAEFAQNLTNSKLNIVVKPDIGTQISVAPNDKMQKMILNPSVRSIDVITSGTGFAVAQLMCKYVLNVKNDTSKNVSSTYCNETATLKICGTFDLLTLINSQQSVIISVLLPSGFVYESASGEKLQKVETEHDKTKVLVYTDPSPVSQCFALKLSEDFVVKNRGNFFIEIWNSHDPSKKSYVSFNLANIVTC